MTPKDKRSFLNYVEKKLKHSKELLSKFRSSNKAQNEVLEKLYGDWLLWQLYK